MTSNNPQPIDVLRDGSLKASLWYQSGAKNGPFITVSLAKTYRDNQGHLADSTSFIGTDLLKISRLADRAYERSGEILRQFRNSPDQPDLLDRDDDEESERGRAGRDFDRGAQGRQQRSAAPR